MVHHRLLLDLGLVGRGNAPCPTQLCGAREEINMSYPFALKCNTKSSIAYNNLPYASLQLFLVAYVKVLGFSTVECSLEI